MREFVKAGEYPTALLMRDANDAAEYQRLFAIPPAPVSDFPAPRLEPLCYPGKRPEHSFTTSENEVWAIRAVQARDRVQFTVATPEGFVDIDDALRFYGVATMADRYPIVGFGSNACPGQLSEKFSKCQDTKNEITNEGDRLIVPTLRGSLNDVAVAYSSKLGIRGYIFAELIAAHGAETQAFVNFLSTDQLKRMFRSEGAYTLCDIGAVAIEGLLEKITAYGFVGKNNVLQDANGQTILLDSVNTKGVDLPAMSEDDLLTMLAHEFGDRLDDLYPNSPFFAGSASNLMAYMSYRTDFLRRADTLGTKYTHHPANGEQPDELIGVTFQKLLVAAGRVSTSKLLDSIPDERQDVVPLTFGELYHGSKR